MDSTGDYGSQFYAMGVLMVCGGVLVLLAILTGMDKKYGDQQTADQQPAHDKPTNKADKV